MCAWLYKKYSKKVSTYQLNMCVESGLVKGFISSLLILRYLLIMSSFYESFTLTIHIQILFTVGIMPSRNLFDLFSTCLIKKVFEYYRWAGAVQVQQHRLALFFFHRYAFGHVAYTHIEWWPTLNYGRNCKMFWKLSLTTIVYIYGWSAQLSFSSVGKQNHKFTHIN